MPETRINTGFPKHFCLLKLNRSRRFTRQIIHYTVYALHLIYNSCHNLLQYLKWNLGAIRGHEIAGIDCPERDCVIVGTLITHNTDTAHVGQCCEILSKVLGKSCLGNLFAVDVICILFDTYLLFSYTVVEEYNAIGDAMKMRGIRFGGGKASAMLEYRLVPVIMCSVKIGEELNAAALTRGLGGPVKRTI